MKKDLEDTLAYVEASLAIEGLELTAEDIEALERCLRGESTFEREVQSAIDEAISASVTEAATMPLLIEKYGTLELGFFTKGKRSVHI